MTTAATATSRAAHASADLAAHLRDSGDARLADLLTTRPDLATPAPSSITALATRAGSAASVSRALGQINRPALTVAEALAVLAGPDAPVSVAAVSHAVGFTADGEAHLLLDRALAVGSPEAMWLVPRAAEILEAGRPLGLGPPLRELQGDSALGPERALRAEEAGRPASGPRANGAPGAGDAPGDAPADEAAVGSAMWPTTAAAVQEALADAPEAAARMLQALTWGPAVGAFDQMPPAVQWLLEARLVHRMSETRIVLPREIALALREGRLARDVPQTAPVSEAPVREATTVAAEATQAGEHVLREVDVLVDSWGQAPPAVLRTGGVGVRDLKALGAAIGAESDRAALVAELAGMLGLVGQHMDAAGSVWAPTTAALDREPDPLPTRWATLAAAWLDSERTPWLVGTRTDKGALRSALAPDLQRSWAPRLRRRVLEALAARPVGGAPDAAAVQEHLAWHAPRSAPPVETVAAILAEAAALGITGAGALSAAGRVLVGGEGGASSEAAKAPTDLVTRAAEAFAADLPETVEALFIQGDLTGIVPGRPEPELAQLLEHAAAIESRGSAMTVRFTAESVRRALDTGTTADQLLQRLAAYSRTPLPQPLEYLVGDVARTHGQLRVGRAASFLRAEDEGALAGVLGDRRLADLGLQMLAPTVVVSPVGPQELLEALTDAGYSALAEGPDGQVLALGRRTVRATRGMGVARGTAAAPVRTHITQSPEELADLVTRMREGESRATSGNGHSHDPVHALELLRQAAAGGTEVDLVIAGSAGASQQHRVRPLSVAAGRVRVLDVGREAELTVAAHRIVSVACAGQPGYARQLTPSDP